MSLQIFLAHTGVCLEVESRAFTSLESLKTWIGKKSEIKEVRQILMTARGKQVRLQTLFVEKEVFVYDRDLLAKIPDDDSRPSLPRVLVPEAFLPTHAPDTLENEDSLEAWQKLFRDRRAWAIELSKTCEGMLRDARKHDAEATVIQRATAIAVENVKQHVGGLNQKHADATGWLGEVLGDHKMLLNNWDKRMQKLPTISAHAELKKFLQLPGKAKKNPNAAIAGSTLEDFVDSEAAWAAATFAGQVSQQLTNKMLELDNAYTNVIQDSSGLVENFNRLFGTSQNDIQQSANVQAHEIDVVVKKISSDYESILGLSSSPRTVAAISKTALLHTRNFLPSLQDLATEVDQLLRSTAERKNHIMDSALIYMQRISNIESLLANIQANLARLDIGAEGGAALDTIGFVHILPLIYASLLIEGVRRQEWSEKMATNASSLGEDLKSYQDEEEKRRKKWLKTVVGGYLTEEATNSVPLRSGDSVKTQEQVWPHLTRNDIDNFVADIKSSGEFPDTLKEIEELLKHLGAPTQQHSHRMNTFKNGSVYDANFNQNSVLIRGDDDLLRSLQNDKMKLEDRLRGSDSRIRKLEDLLHRQSQIQRPSSAVGPPPSPRLHYISSSPKVNESASRRSSMSSRPVSTNFAIDENVLAQRLMKTEAELSTERAKSTQLQDDAANQLKHQADLSHQVQEATNTQKDLMDNLEAQRHEFDGERRLFEDENSKLKVKVEELEEELDRLLGSHDNARISIEERSRRYDAELDKIRGQAAEEVQVIQGQLDVLQSDFTMQCEETNERERQVQDYKEAIVISDGKLASLQYQLERRDEEQEAHQETLQKTLNQLSPHSVVPDEFGDLVENVRSVSVAKNNILEQTLQALESKIIEYARLQTQAKDDQNLRKLTTERLRDEETEVFSLREKTSKYHTRLAQLESELGVARLQLDELRSTLGIVEEESKGLRDKLSEEEKKVEGLTSQFASATTGTEALESEWSARTKEIESLRMNYGDVAQRLENRARRAEEISAHLFSHINRLSRLLENLGFIVTKEEDKMVVQRAPRTSTGNSTMIDQSQSMNRTLSNPLQVRNDDEPQYLHWALADDPAIELQSYDTFLREVKSFDIDIFSEAIIKRVKEAEHIARKWQREAKSYRDKAHRAQLEAHEKIAYRSFKEGDLALFLPTRNQATRPWAAFNVGAPHYFLREQDSHKLRTRDWLVARISKVESRVVDLSQSINGLRPPSSGRRQSLTSNSEGGISLEDENPFELSDGLRWCLLDAAEEKPGAPTTPGLGKSTVASANVDAKGSIQRKKDFEEGGATRTLTKNLDSRRSSTNSKRSLVGAALSPDPKIPIPERAIGEGADEEQTPVADRERPVPDSTEPGQEEECAANSIPRSQASSPSKPFVPSPALSTRAQSPQKSPTKAKSRAWESLWSLDLSLESGGKKK